MVKDLTGAFDCAPWQPNCRGRAAKPEFGTWFVARRPLEDELVRDLHPTLEDGSHVPGAVGSRVSTHAVDLSLGARTDIDLWPAIVMTIGDVFEASTMGTPKSQKRIRIRVSGFPPACVVLGSTWKSVMSMGCSSFATCACPPTKATQRRPRTRATLTAMPCGALKRGSSEHYFPRALTVRTLLLSDADFFAAVLAETRARTLSRFLR